MHGFVKWLGLFVLICGCVSKPAPVTRTANPHKTPPIPPVVRKLSGVSAPVTNYAVAYGIPVTNNVNLAWNPAPTATGYNLYKGPSTKFYTNEVSVGNVTNATAQVAPGSSNFFAVTAYNNAGESPFSNESVYTAPAVTGVTNLAFIQTFVETNNTLTGTWGMVVTFPTVTITNPPSPLFYRTRIAITYTNTVNH